MKSLIFSLPLFLALASARNLHIRQTADNLQTFTGALGASADAITFSGDTTRPFLVNGNTFVNFAAAAQRTCDIQFNACADQANSGAAFSVNDCQTQKDACDAAQAAATVTTFDSTAAIASTTTSAVAAASTTAVAACPVGKVRREVQF